MRFPGPDGRVVGESGVGVAGRMEPLPLQAGDQTPEGHPPSYGNGSVCAGPRWRTGHVLLGWSLDVLEAGSPLGKANALSEGGEGAVLRYWWARLDSNQGPRAYQARALTT